MTWRIRIAGQVQGVGFRPFVWKVAVDRHLTGQVLNGMSGVDILVNGTEAEVSDFFQYLLQNPPASSRITHSSLEQAGNACFQTFSIKESEPTGHPTLLITPDIALCSECQTEMNTPINNRYRYAFTTCTCCGPRYSVIEALPYDRENTTMHIFPMCPDCQNEYNNPLDRRFFAQTNSCPVCGIQMQLTDKDGVSEETDPEAIIQKTVERWSQGAIIAIKGIGGYLLTCDATNPEAIARLRTRKHRPSKPFAVMYPRSGILEGDVVLNDTALNALKSPAAPIVLLEVRPIIPSGLAMPEVAPELDKVGVMLPYAPLFELLLSAFNRPIVATSGNISGSPIVYQETAVDGLSAVADFWLSHNRNIVVPQDDSVITFCDEQSVVLRRSRGYAPTLLLNKIQPDGTPVVALGAEMKGTFTITYSNYFFVSQYWGDLSDYDTQQRYEQFLRRTVDTFKIRPAVVLGDLHPAYFTSNLGQVLSNEWGVLFRQAQHHEAHLAAVLAENDLIHCQEPVLGVIWDGTGLGYDGQIWGGEFFLYDTGKISRIAHLPYFPLLLGDKMPREPRISALALFGRMADVEHLLRPKFSEKEWSLYSRMRSQHQGVQTSSMGRVFDAVAALLGLADTISYEGEAALLLEVNARRFYRNNGLDSIKEGYFSGLNLEKEPISFDWLSLLLLDIRQGQPKEYIAARFHYSLIELLEGVARQQSVRKLAFSGGVFQNTLLIELIRFHCAGKYQLFFHQQLSPNDECISFGQWARIYAMDTLSKAPSSPLSYT